MESASNVVAVMNPVAKLGIGPMSPEIAEAVFVYSHNSGQPLMLIASKNQIDWDGGYVNKWTTTQYVQFITLLRQKYPKARVYLCRDHCGPGFKNDDLKDVYRTIDDDIANGFDLIHIDFCHLSRAYERLLDESKRAIGYILKNKPDMLIEVGTDENNGVLIKDLDKIEKEMAFFTAIGSIQFFVTQTGSLVKEMNQIGRFDRSYVSKVKQLADKYRLKLKEHNCDYVTREDLHERKGLIDTVNVAPQFGVIQTLLTLQKCAVYGIDSSDFLKEAYESGRWKKWLHYHTAANKHLCAIVAGHYAFSGDAYRRLVEKINVYEDFRQSVISEMMKNFALYINNL